MPVAQARRAPRIALALAGGGPLGAVYEIGALCALTEAVPALDLCALDHYVGVSAGGFIAASLANGMTPHELHAAFIDDAPPSADRFDPAWLMIPAWGEYLRRAARAPWITSAVMWRLALGRSTLSSAAERLGPLLPTGVFASDEIHRRLSRLFARPGRSNDFRQLRSRLTLVATDLDTGEAVPFGQPGWDHVPISRAVQASAALPGLFPPVEIDGRTYVDGALKKTMHASVALDEGVDLMLCLNPLVPFDASPASPASASATSGRSRARRPRIADGGLPAVLGQTFRAMIHSRMALGMKHYERAYPRTDIVLIEPDPRDPTLHQANTFSYRQRRELAEHAYAQTRAWLRRDAAQIGRKLARHGLALDTAALADSTRTLKQAIADAVADAVADTDAASTAARHTTPQVSPHSDLGQAIGTLQQTLRHLEQHLELHLQQHHERRLRAQHPCA